MLLIDIILKYFADTSRYDRDNDVYLEYWQTVRIKLVFIHNINIIKIELIILLLSDKVILWIEAVVRKSL